MEPLSKITEREAKPADLKPIPEFAKRTIVGTLIFIFIALAALALHGVLHVCRWVGMDAAPICILCAAELMVLVVDFLAFAFFLFHELYWLVVRLIKTPR
jgi:hypothetical protein